MGKKKQSYASAFDRVKKNLDAKAGDKKFTEDVWMIVGRLEKVKSMSPEFKDIDVSDNLKGLLKIVGKKKLLPNFSLKNKAASLL